MVYMDSIDELDFHTIQSILKQYEPVFKKGYWLLFPYYSVYFKALKRLGPRLSICSISILFSLF